MSENYEIYGLYHLAGVGYPVCTIHVHANTLDLEKNTQTGIGRVSLKARDISQIRIGGRISIGTETYKVVQIAHRGGVEEFYIEEHSISRPFSLDELLRLIRTYLPVQAMITNDDGNITISLAPQPKCPVCSGTGKTEHRCFTCGGSGREKVFFSCSKCGGTGKANRKCYKCNGTGYLD